MFVNIIIYAQNLLITFLINLFDVMYDLCLIIICGLMISQKLVMLYFELSKQSSTIILALFYIRYVSKFIGLFFKIHLSISNFYAKTAFFFDSG